MNIINTGTVTRNDMKPTISLDVAIKTINEAIDNINDEMLSECVTVIWNKTDVASPASIHYHHAYKYGLAIHTAEMLQLFEAILNSEPISSHNFGFLDSRDLMLAAIILHDVGKGQQHYEFVNEKWEHTERDKRTRTPHIHKSLVSFIQTATIFEVDKSIVYMISHMIEAHHGLRDWGAMDTPRNKYAQMLHQLDMISNHCLQD